MQFETIHPCLDGNRCIGRLLIAFILHHDRLLSRPLLYLSLYLKQHRAENYRLLDLVRLQGNWEAWIDLFSKASNRQQRMLSTRPDGSLRYSGKTIKLSSKSAESRQMTCGCFARSVSGH